MNNLDVAGILRTYAEKARNARNTEHLKRIVSELKAELNLKKLRMDKDSGSGNMVLCKECIWMHGCDHHGIEGCFYGERKEGADHE